MPITNEMGRNTPIKIEQCTLNKFFPELPKPKEHSLIKRLKQINSLSVNEGYTLRMEHDGTICIKEEYCLNCGKRIIKNGYNRRIAILADGLGRHEFQVHRITPNLHLKTEITTRAIKEELGNIIWRD